MTSKCYTTALAVWATWLLATVAPAQGLRDLYCLRPAVSQVHVEYHQVAIGPGKEVLLGDLQGPGKVTYFYITDGTQGRFYPGLVLKVIWDDEVEIQNQRGATGQVPSQDDYTSVAFWYQEEPHRPFGLQPFAERVGASKAVEYKR